jgi:thiamine biosynthesis protein ThiS
MKVETIRINGEKRALPANSTIAACLDDLGLDPRAVAVEHNGVIIRRPSYAATRLDDGDRLEIVRFVQGG